MSIFTFSIFRSKSCFLTHLRECQWHFNHENNNPRLILAYVEKTPLSQAEPYGK